MLGETWVDHWGRHKSEATRGVFDAAAKNNPILRGVERFHAGNVGGVVGIDLAGLRVERKEHRAFEAMPLREDFAEHRQALLGAIFFVAGQKDDVLAFARSGFAVIHDAVTGIDPAVKNETHHD